MDKTIHDSYYLNSVGNSLQILDLIGEKAELSAAEICGELGFGRSSTFRMLYTLEKYGYVLRTGEGKYRLGLKFVSLGAVVANNQDFSEVCRPYMRKLRDEFDETVQLGILTESGKAMFIAKEASTKNIQMNTRVWKETEAYSMGSGKVLLAYQNEEAQKKFVEDYTYTPYTENTIKNSVEFIAQLKTIRERGFAEDLEESEVGLVCFAAPILGLGGKCMASLSISGPAARMYPRRDPLTKAVIMAARDISEILGYKK